VFTPLSCNCNCNFNYAAACYPLNADRFSLNGDGTVLVVFTVQSLPSPRTPPVRSIGL
jgi:hypothetical protein